MQTHLSADQHATTLGESIIEVDRSGVAASLSRRVSNPLPAEGLRLALFSGNYNCVKDGANNALNRLVRYMLDRGAAVRVYSPTVARPAFEPEGDLVSVPSIPIPLRPEYRLTTGLSKRVEEDIRRFQPTLLHLAAPDALACRAMKLGRTLGIPVVSSLHTRFETYFEFYGLGFVRGLIEWHLKRFYSGCDAVLVPNEALGDELRKNCPGVPVSLWGRGVDREQFSPLRRDMAWRRSLGFADSDIVVLFFGRLVREKGVGVYEQVMKRVLAANPSVRALVVGDGPAGQEMRRNLGNAVFTGHLQGDELGRAVASADILLNPSVTEAFGNVNLEAMAAGLAVVSADSASARALIETGENGMLLPATDIDRYVEALEWLAANPGQRLALGKAAQHAAWRFDWDGVLLTVFDTYQMLGGVRGQAALRPL